MTLEHRQIPISLPDACFPTGDSLVKLAHTGALWLGRVERGHAEEGTGLADGAVPVRVDWAEGLSARWKSTGH
jgi:hypothetical protein